MQKPLHSAFIIDIIIFQSAFRHLYWLILVAGRFVWYFPVADFQFDGRVENYRTEYGTTTLSVELVENVEVCAGPALD